MPLSCSDMVATESSPIAREAHGLDACRFRLTTPAPSPRRLPPHTHPASRAPTRQPGQRSCAAGHASGPTAVTTADFTKAVERMTAGRLGKRARVRADGQGALCNKGYAMLTGINLRV